MGTLTLQGSTSGQITIAPPAVAGTNTLTLPASTGTLVTSESATVSGNLTFTGTGNRITGDFSNATVSNRVAFQTSTTNGNTVLLAITDGTGTASALQLSNTNNRTNAAYAELVCNATESQIKSSAAGTGTYLPITLYTNNSERMRIDTSGNVGIGTTSIESFGGGHKTLEVSGSTNTQGGVFKTATSGSAGSGTTGIEMLMYTDSVGGSISVSTANPISFLTTATERMRITPAGGVSFGSSGTAYGTSGQYLKSNGDAPPSWASLSASGSLVRAPQLLTSGTSYTTPSTCNAIYVEMLGGGGGGGGTNVNGSGNVMQGGNGGGAGYGIIYLTVTPSTAYSYAIGSGGGSGSAGGNTTLTIGATTYTAGGGSGGQTINGTAGAGAGGAGGTTTNLGPLSFSGGAGDSGNVSAITYGGTPRYIYFSATVTPSSGNISGTAAGSYGCGGGGSKSNDGANRSGGNGSQGYIRIWEFT